LLVSRPKRGYFVRQVSLKEVLDAYRVRGQLEGLACRVLSEQGVDDAAMATLADCIDTGERILADGRLSDDSLPWRENNERFHRTLVGATGNAALIEATDPRTPGGPSRGHDDRARPRCQRTPEAQLRLGGREAGRARRAPSSRRCGATATCRRMATARNTCAIPRFGATTSDGSITLPGCLKR